MFGESGMLGYSNKASISPTFRNLFPINIVLEAKAFPLPN